MPALKLKLAIDQGATFRKVLTWEIATPPAAPVLVDLTGYTARMQARTDVDTPAFLFELTTENGGITLGGALGTIALYLSDTATSALSFDAGVFDLELKAPGGDVTRFLAGTVTLSPEVTR
jgi:hypothetical protein